MCFFADKNWIKKFRVYWWWKLQQVLTNICTLKFMRWISMSRILVSSGACQSQYSPSVFYSRQYLMRLLFWQFSFWILWRFTCFRWFRSACGDVFQLLKCEYLLCNLTIFHSLVFHVVFLVKFVANLNVWYMDMFLKRNRYI